MQVNPLSQLQTLDKPTVIKSIEPARKAVASVVLPGANAKVAAFGFNASGDREEKLFIPSRCEVTLWANLSSEVNRVGQIDYNIGVTMYGIPLKTDEQGNPVVEKDMYVGGGQEVETGYCHAEYTTKGNDFAKSLPNLVNKTNPNAEWHQATKRKGDAYDASSLQAGDWSQSNFWVGKLRDLVAQAPFMGDPSLDLIVKHMPVENTGKATPLGTVKIATSEPKFEVE